MGTVAPKPEPERKTRWWALLVLTFPCVGQSHCPAPSRRGKSWFALRPVAAAKVALYTAMREQGLTNVPLGERLGVSEAAVRKLLNPDHRSHLSTIEKALHAVGLGLVVETAPWPLAPAPAAGADLLST